MSAALVHSLGDESVDVADFCDAGTVPAGVTYDASTGAVVIDLSHWGERGSSDVLSVENSNDSSGKDACANRITSVTFEYSVAGEGFTNLAIGDDAFYQFSLSGDIALASVEFPAGLVTLDIGDGAFYQFSISGDSALASVEFPAGLVSLNIGDNAFRQEPGTGKTALESVVFPASLESLADGKYAFYQVAWYGTSLASVVFPANADSLSIGNGAFLAQPTRTDVVLFFPFVEAPSVVSLGTGVTRDVSRWVWLGADGAHTSDARDGDPAGWGTTKSYELHGARAASFEANGGAGAETLYAFPSVGGVSQFAPLDGVGGLDPAGFSGPAVDYEYSVTLPGTSWPVEGQAAFQGWCAGAWVEWEVAGDWLASRSVGAFMV